MRACFSDAKGLESNQWKLANSNPDVVCVISVVLICAKPPLSSPVTGFLKAQASVFSFAMGSRAMQFLLQQQFWTCAVYRFTSLRTVFLSLVRMKQKMENVSGYYRNLGSLRAGTRHHGEFSVMGTPSLPTFPEVLLAHASQMTGQLSRSMHIACKCWQAERQYKCGARDNYVRIRYWTPLSWSCSEHGDLRDVSFPLSGNRGYDSNRRRFPLELSRDRRILRYGNVIQSRAACTSYTLAKIEHTHNSHQ